MSSWVNMAADLPPDPCWRHLISERKEHAAVCIGCPERPYISLAVPTSAEEHKLSLRRIVFTVKSHDQGFSGEPQETKGTYSNSWTFFEVLVFDSSRQLRFDRYDVQRNVQACLEQRTHTVVWDCRTEALLLESTSRNIHELSNAPVTHRAWLDAIQAGDIIQLVPRAIFAAWVNFVFEARIEVWYEVMPIPRNAQLPRILSMNVSNQGTYSSYGKLDPLRRQMRVLRLEPEQAEDNNALRLSLHNQELGDTGRMAYEALSYCWGSAHVGQEVFIEEIDGQKVAHGLRISDNLHSALRSMRLPKQPRFLWVDQICINQNDPGERASQVTLMGQVYASAMNVIVWLGDLDESTQEDMSVFRNVADKFGETGIEHCAIPSQERGHRCRQLHSSVLWDNGMDYSTKNDRIFNRPWFTRVWVLQEVWNTPDMPGEVNTDSRIRVRCGDKEVPWAAVLQAHYCLQQNFYHVKNNMISKIWFELFDFQRSASPFNCLPAPRADILTVLVAALDMGASDPRDKIFALLSFGRETQHTRELPDLITPEYTKSVVQVFMDFTRWWIAYHGSLRILSAVHTQHDRSWLDNFGDSKSSRDPQGWEPSQRPTWTFWHCGRSQWIQGTLGGEADCSYNASGAHSVQPFPNPSLLEKSGFELPLQGIRLGSIVTMEPWSDDLYLNGPNDMRRAFHKVFDTGCYNFPWKGVGSKAPSSNENVEKSQMPHYKSHQYSRQFTEFSSGPGNEGCFPCYGRPIMRLEGGLVGLAPHTARLGDVVVVLYGASVPFILREHDSLSWRLVGECYVEGVMQGEAVRDDIQPETFCLI